MFLKTKKEDNGCEIRVGKVHEIRGTAPHLGEEAAVRQRIASAGRYIPTPPSNHPLTLSDN